MRTEYATVSTQNNLKTRISLKVVPTLHGVAQEADWSENQHLPHPHRGRGFGVLDNVKQIKIQHI